MALSLSKTLPKITYRNLLKTMARQRTRAVVNPFQPATQTKRANQKAHISIYDYNLTQINHLKPATIEDCFHFNNKETVTWINLDGLNKEQMESICNKYGIHQLIQEDIVSYGQRPKVDEIENVLFALLNMLFFNAETGQIEQEQISIVLGKHYVISFQEDAEKDVFDPIRKHLAIATSKLREKEADYLFYSLIDIIADSYLSVIEKIGQQIEKVEELILQHSTKLTFEKISQLRKDLILLKRNISPVKDMVASLVRTETTLLEEKTTKYFKDVHDHVAQANDLIDNYRDLLMGMQDMYVNNINLRMNEVMKTLAIITAIMAPATVIGGIFGMNFDIIPYAHHKWGFYGTVIVMVVIPLIMFWKFKKWGWFLGDSNANGKS